jgi:hypothetical protein
MTLITKPEFISLLRSTFLRSINENREQYYIGMGNPNSDILIVGKEKALNSDDEKYTQIIQHESNLNIDHWISIVDSYNHLSNIFDSILMNRTFPLEGFNPFCPMLFSQTAKIVQSKPGHTYWKIQKLINSGRIDDFSSPKNNVFNYCFITEINHMPALRNSGFNRVNNSHRNRELFISNNPFFHSFKVVIVHVGVNSKKYIGSRYSETRFLSLQKMFNSELINNPQTIQLDVNQAGRAIEADLYFNNKKTKLVVVCNQLSGSAGWTNNALLNFTSQWQNLI